MTNLEQPSSSTHRTAGKDVLNSNVGNIGNIGNIGAQTNISGRVQPSKEDGNRELSGTVTNTRDTLRTRTAVSAATVVKTILQTHREYAGRRAEQLALDEGAGEVLPVDDWLKKVRALYDPTLVPKLHGKLVIIGLALVDADLRRQLQQDDFLTALMHEVTESFPEIFSEEGHKLYIEAGLAAREVLQGDDPLQKLNADQLGRAAFARFLATCIEQFAQSAEKSNQAFAIHLHAPWGAGKSTLLYFLKELLDPSGEKPPDGYLKRILFYGQQVRSHLQRTITSIRAWRNNTETEKPGWIVVEFNAWQHQRIRPPWWPLMERVFQSSRSELNNWNKIREFWWRAAAGRLHYILAAILLIWLFFMARPMLTQMVQDQMSAQTQTEQQGANAQEAEQSNNGAASAGHPYAVLMTFLAGIFENGYTIITVLLALWTGALTVSRVLLLNSASTAQTYVEQTADPMKGVSDHFSRLITRLKPKRVLIVIDDLDRCQSAYVIELLEGIQTLFRNSPVVFVVAADQAWLNACFQDRYKDLLPSIQEREKRLGMRFLEKVFQFSTPLPNIPEKMQEAYWSSLLQGKTTQKTKAAEEDRQAKQEEMDKAGLEAGVLGVVAQTKNSSFETQQMTRELAVMRITASPVQSEIEHYLRRYHRLLESNPRAMKRLLNTYLVNRAVDTLSWGDLDRHQLVLWTILSMRWPLLAQALSAQTLTLSKQGSTPSKLQGKQAQASSWLDTIIAGNLELLPREVNALFKPEDTNDLISVVKGEFEPGKPAEALERKTLEKCARLYA